MKALRASPSNMLVSVKQLLSGLAWDNDAETFLQSNCSAKMVHVWNKQTRFDVTAAFHAIIWPHTVAAELPIRSAISQQSAHFSHKGGSVPV